jgi:hypothetical protein
MRGIPRQLTLLALVLAAALAGCSSESLTTVAPSADVDVVLSRLAATPTGATMWVGKDDYVPTEWVDLHGAGWAPNETIALTVFDAADDTLTHTGEAVTDELGTFWYEFKLPDRYVPTYIVVGVGEASGTAMITFADSIAEAAMSFNSNTAKEGNASAELTISVPAVQAGDVLIAQIALAKDFGTGVVCTPAGWTPILRTNRESAGKIVLQSYHLVATSGQDARSVTWQFKTTASACGTTNNPRVETGATGVVFRLTGVDATKMPSASAGAAGAHGSSSPPYRAPAVASATPGSLVFRFFAANVAEENRSKVIMTGPAGADRRLMETRKPSSNPIERSFGAFTHVQGGTTSATTGTFDASFNTGAEWVAQTIVLHPAPPTHMVFSTAPHSGVTNECLGPITVRTRNAYGGLANVLEATTVSFATSGSGAFFAGAGCTSPQASATMLPGQNALSFYYRPSAVGSGSHTVSVSSTVLAGASQVATVGKASAAVQLGGLTRVFVGTPLAPTVATVPSDLPIVWTNAPQVNAGAFSVTASVDHPDYVGTASATFVIERAAAIIDVQGASVAYDGNAHTATGTATGVNDEALAGLDLGDSFTDAPGGTTTWTFTDTTGNYHDASGSVAITIDKVSATIDVQGTTVTYDGTAHGATGTATGVQGEDLSANLHLGSTFIDVPGGAATWTFTGGTNYHDATGSVAIAIEKATATIDVQGATVTYDGNAHGATGAAAGVQGEDLTANLDLGDTFTDAPGGTATWTFSGGTNYHDASGSVQITIDKADASIDVQGTTVTYDGNAHGATGTATGIQGEDLTANLDLGDTFTDFPGGTATWTFSGGTNYRDASGTVDVTIDKADATIDVHGATGTYDGHAHGATGTATGVHDEDLSANLQLGATFTAAPGGTATWTFSGATNYHDASGSVQVVIESVVGDEPWNVVGFHQPVGIASSRFVPDGALPTGPVVWNTARGGSTIPLKFNVYAGATEITSVDTIGATFSLYLVTCSSGSEAPVEAEAGVSAPGSTFLVYADGQFHRNWQTSKVSRDTCFRLTTRFADGSALHAYFKLR